MPQRGPRSWSALVPIAFSLACSDDGSGAATGNGGGAGARVVETGGAPPSGGSGGRGGGATGTGGLGTGGSAAQSGGEGGAGGHVDGGAGGAVVDARADNGSGRGAADAGSDAGPDTGAPEGGGVVDSCADCWIKNLFPQGRPATITVTGTIQKNDNVCVIVFGGGQCQAQNSPPCNPSSGRTTVSLDLTLDAVGNLTVEAPYQDMCAQDYFCAVSGPGCAIPTSYAVPTDTTFQYAPRSTDYCRRDLNGVPYPVSHVVDVRIVGRTIVIDQLCTTHMLNQSSLVTDTRNWTTTIAL